MFVLTCAALALAVVGVVCRGRAERAWWLGIALFGWGYLALAFLGRPTLPRLPTIQLLNAVCSGVGLNVEFGNTDAPMGVIVLGTLGTGVPLPILQPVPAYNAPSQIGHCLWALIAAVLGGLVARTLVMIRPDGSAMPDDEAPALEEGQE